VPIIGGGFSEIPGQKFDLILNATSASLSNQLPPLPDGLLNTQTTCYDLAYSNKATPFVLWGQQFTNKSLDGLGMLIEQAAEAFYLWRGIRPVTQPIIEALMNDRL
jgi:shikimate dehydrogenase